MNEYVKATQWRGDARPEEAGFESAALSRAVDFAVANETSWPKDLTKRTESPRKHEPPPWNEALGPISTERGGPAGLIVRAGRVAARWGDTHHVDMTYSVAKSYYSLLAGVAMTRGLIRSLDDPVRDYALDDGFESAQNHEITWRHLLQQTSEWEGKVFDKPDQLDRNRQVGPDGDNSLKGTYRELQRPGTYWEYNDVRVNRLGLSLLHVFRRPLSTVLSEAIMEPIGASDTWEWQPYRNSWVTIDGESMPSLPGGGHWGGGIVINSEDHARVGHLVLARGEWDGRQLIDRDWFHQLEEPCPVKPDYGLMWWLNAGKQHFAHAPEESLFASGAGRHLIWVCRDLQLVVVARWIEEKSADGLIERIIAAMDEG